MHSYCMGLYEDAYDVEDYALDESHFDEAYHYCYLGRTEEYYYSDYIITLTNQERFDSQDYRSETPVIQESIVVLLAIPPTPVQF